MSEQRWDYQEPAGQQSILLPLLMVGAVALGLVVLIGGVLALCAY